MLELPAQAANKVLQPLAELLPAQAAAVLQPLAELLPAQVASKAQTRIRRNRTRIRRILRTTTRIRVQKTSIQPLAELKHQWS